MYHINGIDGECSQSKFSVEDFLPKTPHSTNKKPPPPHNPSTSKSTNGNKSSKSKGAIVGFVFSIIISVILIVVSIYCFYTVRYIPATICLIIGIAALITPIILMTTKKSDENFTFGITKPSRFSPKKSTPRPFA